ncbi:MULTISPECIES: YfiR/HmsC family protein [unclassified Iodidimonas]|jgi:non-ribosomal peptide synthetase component E (peptide arylation enzyme)|uniref:YfiR/HmsC family protein n=1 Tax=unclassified Iodidimonas TaxID=2626145 RepID=UPI0024826F2D|nr:MULTISPECIES: YfiR/HmsC family protein [unclassified Iodidimonas]
MIDATTGTFSDLYRGKRPMRHALSLVFSLVLGTCLASQALATSEKDLQVATRALSFVSDLPPGSLDTAIIYDAGNGASKSDADAILAFLTANPAAGKSKLVPRLLPAGDLSALAGAKIAFVADQTTAFLPAIAAEAKSKAVITVSSDRACVEGGACVVGVSSAPRVEILVNKAAAEATGTSFGSAFLMLIKEI